MEPDKTQVAPMPRPARSARPRLVLGVTLLLVGVGDLLFMNIVLLPQVLAVEETPPRPTVSAVPVAEPPAQAGPEAGRAAVEELAVAPVLVPPSPPPEESAPPSASSSAPTAPAPAEQPAAAQPAPAPPAARIAQPTAEPPAPARAPTPAREPAPTPERATRSFAPLLFIRSTAWLSPKAEDALTKLAAAMKADPSLRVRLDGHTDDYGPERFNDMLSWKRARRARAYLQDLGIAPARIDIKGYGSERPAETERNAKARARNRRVEITLY